MTEVTELPAIRLAEQAVLVGERALISVKGVDKRYAGARARRSRL